MIGYYNIQNAFLSLCKAMPAQKTKRVDQSAAVLAALKRARQPLGAYKIIASLRGQINLAPPTAYRILDRLMASGHVHKVRSLNAFVACKHENHQEDAAFAICDACGTVTEFSLPKLSGTFGKWSQSQKFELAAAVVELHGKCASCQVKH